LIHLVGVATNDPSQIGTLHAISNAAQVKKLASVGFWELNS
jgi:hypothetical protein